MDVYDTEKWGGSCPDVKAQTFWKDEYQQRYLKITAAHRNTILGSFAGHTHQDEFRLATGDFIHVTPSVTPVFGNNPAFEIVNAARDGRIVDYTSYHLPNATLPWARQYAFREAYGQREYDNSSLSDLAASIAADTETRSQYFGRLPSGAPEAAAAALAQWQGYWCGLTVMTAPSFASCWCGAAGKSPQ
jgi:sphingomyelin phosphodiesterase acid-like 3